jgi:hypothetical protein
MSSDAIEPPFITCDCQCHLPIGYRRRADAPPPPVMRPCKECASNEH